MNVSDASLVGTTIGNYKIVKQIGEGGMGVVYLAEHPVIGRKVAVKLLHFTFARDADIVARFFNEARAIHLIGHENIVEIMDFGQTSEGQPYFIMEYLVGEPLADRITRGPVPTQEAVHITAQICGALQAAHDKNIVHRDLKPHNVYLLRRVAGRLPDVKILDFGVAKMLSGWDTAQSGRQSVKTRTGSLMGTPLYMSPEQCRGAGKLDHRTDIYSLAVILFEMIANRAPFLAEGVGELFAKHMLEPAPSLAEFAPNTPPHVVAAVAKALSKDLDDRFPTMLAFRDTLTGAAPITAPDLQSRRPRSHATVHQRGSSGRVTAGSPGAATRPSESTLPPVESTTLSSAVSQLDLEKELAGLRVRSRKGLVIGALAVAGAAAALVVMVNRKHAADPVVTTTSTSSDPESSKTEAADAQAAPPAPETVSIRFEAEPAEAHVFRKVDGKDLGAVPLEIKLPRGEDEPEYVLRAEGHKERLVSVSLMRDQVLHLFLEKTAPPVVQPPKEDKRQRPPPPRHKPKRPTVHDEDGLAVPSF
jgi:serine/threonine-protein kinase